MDTTSLPRFPAKPYIDVTSGAPVLRLLNRLDSVRPQGADSWTAKCPAHADRHPSLSISVSGDGKILVHCFAGCSALAVVQACGLTLADLFPRRLKPSTLEERREAREQARAARIIAATKTLNEESAVALIAAKMVQQGAALSGDDLARLGQALARIESAREVLRGL